MNDGQQDGHDGEEREQAQQAEQRNREVYRPFDIAGVKAVLDRIVQDAFGGVSCDVRHETWYERGWFKVCYIFRGMLQAMAVLWLSVPHQA